MNCFIRSFELTLSINSDDFDKQLYRAIRRAAKAGWVQNADYGYTDSSLKSEGIMILYLDSNKKKKIRLIVKPSSVIDEGMEMYWKPKPGNIPKLLNRLGKLIGTYFNSDYELDDFKLNRMDFAMGIDVGSRGKVLDYIKALHTIGRVKRFSPVKYDREGEFSKDNCFCLMGNTNGIEFSACGSTDTKRVLDVGVKLMAKEVIRAYSGDVDTSGRIAILAKGVDHILMDTFNYIIPQGGYYKKKEAEKLIAEGVKDRPLRRKMLRLLELIPAKKSLHLAQKASGIRDIEKVMDKFSEIGVSPITLSKRHNAKHLKCLHSYLIG